MKPELLVDGPHKAQVTIVLAHGAGAGMETDFMAAFAQGLAAKGLRVVRFEFPYMAQAHETGRRRPPDSQPVLRKAWHNVLESLDTKSPFIGGKSMGGRIASLIADEAGVAGLVCLGYPFHPPGKPDKLRVEHLETIKTPTLIVQGERDALGNRTEVDGYRLSQSIEVCWMPDGDHSFKPRKATGRSQEENWNDGIKAVAEFVERHSA